jgi:DNA-binding response OmpR family regulator
MRILVVEDQHKLANAIKKGLEQEKYAVDVCYDGDSGLAMALDEPYDLMLLDRMLPGSVDGDEILLQLRRSRIHTPVLMLTAKDKVSERVAGLDMGADDYMLKPFAFEELIARIRALLRRPTEVQSSTLSYMDLELDEASFVVKRSGKNIQLSSKEFALLNYLLRNKQKIVSKDKIIAHVWNYDADILPNTVEVYIGYLRNKIDKPFAEEPYIQTLRGFGYRLGSST